MRDAGRRTVALLAQQRRDPSVGGPEASVPPERSTRRPRPRRLHLPGASAAGEDQEEGGGRFESAAGAAMEKPRDGAAAAARTGCEWLRGLGAPTPGCSFAGLSRGGGERTGRDPARVALHCITQWGRGGNGASCPNALVWAVRAPPRASCCPPLHLHPLHPTLCICSVPLLLFQYWEGGLGRWWRWPLGRKAPPSPSPQGPAPPPSKTLNNQEG